ncbi:hypothetical protein BH09BAC2_BH09BAC2_20780 [soil metagenome]
MNTKTTLYKRNITNLLPEKITSQGIRIFVLVGYFLISFFCADAQRLSIKLFGGLANYQGDLQQKKFTFEQNHPAYGFGLGYEVTNHISFRALATFGTISGDDKNYKNNAVRNLNFKTSISEFQLGLEYIFLDLQQRNISPYVFSGIAIYSFNPYTYDTSGNKFFLQPLSTEGEGFIQGKTPYQLTQFSIPLGAGIKININERLKLALEFGFRKTFTDYLDDVSSDYVDKDLLLQFRGAKAVELAYRGGELKNGAPYPAGGSQRGKVNKKDWYYFTTVTTSFTLGGGAGERERKIKSKEMRCPVLSRNY